MFRDAPSIIIYNSRKQIAGKINYYGNRRAIKKEVSEALSCFEEELKFLEEDDDEEATGLNILDVEEVEYSDIIEEVLEEEDEISNNNNEEAVLKVIDEIFDA